MIPLTYGHMIKHKKFKDVCIFVQKAYTFSHKTKIKGLWFNQGFVETFSLNMNARIVIKKEEYSNWYICVENTKCVRKAIWANIETGGLL